MVRFSGQQVEDVTLTDGLFLNFDSPVARPIQGYLGRNPDAHTWIHATEPLVQIDPDGRFVGFFLTVRTSEATRSYLISQCLEIILAQ